MMGDDVTVASEPGKGSVFTKFIGGLAGERTCLASHWHKRGGVLHTKRGSD